MFKIFSTYICRIIYKMQRLEFSGAVRPIYASLGVKRLITMAGIAEYINNTATYRTAYCVMQQTHCCV